MSTTDMDRAPAGPLRAAVLTVSDTRTLATDSSGQAAIDLITASGHVVAARRVVPDSPAEIRAAVIGWARDDRVDLVVTTGGTGLSPRDSTFEALAPAFEKTIPGFGELFRTLSFREVGAAAMVSRAAAGTIGHTVVFLLPGSTAAVRLALAELILPQLGHITRELARRS